MSVEDDKPLNQFNDGKVDAKGRVWGGNIIVCSHIYLIIKRRVVYLLQFC